MRAKLVVHVLVASLFVALLAMPAPAVNAATGPETMITMIGDDYVAGSLTRYFHPGNATIRAEGNASQVTFYVDGGSLGEDYTLEFAAPEGGTLTPGDYPEAERATFRSPGHAGIDISGEGRGCNTIEGWFRVKSISTSGGAVTAFWAVFQQRCSGDRGSMIGEVRYQVPGDGGSALVGPRELRWPDAGQGDGMKVVPVQVVNPGDAPFSVGAASLEGDEAMSIERDDCAGRSLAPGESCAVWVRYVPTDPGLETARLSIPDSTSTIHTVTFEGFVIPGTTRFVASSYPGDIVGQGKFFDYTSGEARFVVEGHAEEVVGRLYRADALVWTIEFSAPRGTTFTEGTTYTGVHTYPFAEDAPGMAVWRGRHSCGNVQGEFTVTEIELDEEGRIEDFGVTFEQRCDDKPSALTGLLDYRVERPNDPPEPPPVHRRKVVLRRDTRRLYGRILAPAGTPASCRANAVVELRNCDGGCHTVARTRTDRNGRFSQRIKTTGEIRYFHALLPWWQLSSGWFCARARSGWV